MMSYAERVIQTPRLTLRALRLEDTGALHEMYGAPGVFDYMSAPYSSTLDELRARLATRIAEHDARGYGMMMAELTATNEIVGRAGFLDWSIEGVDEVEIGYIIAREQWGRGYASEAAIALREHGFEYLRPSRHISLIHPDNIASRRVAEKNGMTMERIITLPTIPLPAICLYAVYPPNSKRVVGS